MKINSFEKAIEELGCNIELTEVKIHKGQVRRFYGTQGDARIMWDEFGRGFLSKRKDQSTCSILPDDMYLRDSNYDLKFS